MAEKRAIPGGIHFGTDGWRGVIADDFTFANVRRVAGAIGLHARRECRGRARLTVGYDTRFHSARFARLIADVLAGNGCEVFLSDTVLSTPALSSSVVDTKSFGGVMVSASHNPAEFNGIKFKTSRGASAPEAVTRSFEKLLDVQEKPKTGEKVLIKNLTEGYLRRVARAVDMDLIRKARLNLVADPMHGAGRGYLSGLLKDSRSTVIEIHADPDPLFGGMHPEPIQPYMNDLSVAVRRNAADAGLATDGDADRIGVVDENGRYLTPHQVFPLILYYLCRYKGLRGKVVQAISLGYVSRRIAEDYGLPWEEVPVGFKNIAQRIMTEKVLAGGEESGGYGYGGYLPERDGILNSLLIIEMLAATGKRLSVLLKEVEKKYGASSYLRTDFRNPGIPKDEFVREMKGKVPKRIAGLAVKEIKDYDGIEFVLEDDSWLLLRPSGTEPIIRVYSESDKLEKTKRIIAWGKQAVSALS